MRKLAILAIVMLGMLLMVGVPGTSADSATLEYRYLMPRPLIDEITDPGNTCTSSADTDAGNDTPFRNCPAGATADNGDVIDINGNGTFSLNPKSATGSGRFTHHFAGGGSMNGTWTATELLSFKTYGPSPILNPTFRTGLAHIRVHLVGDDGTEAHGILTVGCILPQVKMPGGVFEGVRLNVQGLLNFNMETDPRGTLFILTSGDDGF